MDGWTECDELSEAERAAMERAKRSWLEIEPLGMSQGFEPGWLAARGRYADETRSTEMEYRSCRTRLDAADAINRELRLALKLAQSMILARESMSDEAEHVIDAALGVPEDRDA